MGSVTVRVPEVEGNLRALMQALEDLHRRAGRPSLRAMADGQPFSYGSVHTLFAKTSERVPSWRVLQGVVTVLAAQALGSDPERLLNQFHVKWIAAEEQPFERTRSEDWIGYGMPSILSTNPPPPRTVSGVRPEKTELEKTWKTSAFMLNDFRSMATTTFPNILFDFGTASEQPTLNNCYVLDLVKVQHEKPSDDLDRARHDLEQLFFLVRVAENAINAWSVNSGDPNYEAALRAIPMSRGSSKIPFVTVKRVWVDRRLCSLFVKLPEIRSVRGKRALRP